ncbi:MAG: ATP-binding protein [Armatimonadota bacterium]
MTFDDNSVESLRERVQKLEAELNQRTQTVTQLEKVNKELSNRVQEAGENVQPTAELSEMEETLKRMMMRVAMILQGAKCLFLIHDKANEELFAEKPALGFEDDDLKGYRIPEHKGIAGECFREGRPVILYDAETDERAKAEGLFERGVKNGVCVPLIVIKRDEETNRVLDRKIIGVLYVFNKKYGGIFVDEDVKLLERLAGNTAAIINTAESYRQIVKERDEVIDTIESLYAGLVMVNKNGRIMQMNASARQAFGLSAEDVAGARNYEQIITDEKTRDVLRRALEEETGVQDEISLPDKDNPDQNHVFQVQSALVRGESGDVIGTAAIFNDITELRNVDKMKTAFVSTVSHELRTPLTSIKGFISTLVQDTEGFYDTETRHEFYTIIDTECDRLRRLIDDLLNVSRIEAGNALQLHVTEFDVHKVVEKVLRTQNSSTYKKPEHTLVGELDADIPHLMTADEDKVEQILTNLLSNALKYSPKGGEIKISGKVMPGGEMLQFAISDQGMGIPKEQLSKMFQRFHRVDNRDTREIGGTGIGLFLVKALVEYHHGQIWLDSEYGHGTTFFFTIPITQPEEEEGDSGNLSKAVSG